MNPTNEAAVAPEDCLVMISFNDRTAGEVAKRLANYLTSNGRPAFCTGNYCATQAGNWRRFTTVGANKCRYYVPLITFGWQDSDECQYETGIVLNRLAGGKVTIIPVWFDSFDEKYDEQRGHYYKNSWNHFQGVPSKKNDPNTINETILKLIQPLNGAVPKDDCPYVATPNGPVDLCLIMRPATSPLFHLSGATKHVSALQDIQASVKAELPSANVIIADGNHLQYMHKLKTSPRRINVLVLCAEGLSPINEKDGTPFIFHDSDMIDLLKALKPKVLVLIMRYVSKSFVQDLAEDSGISSIIPIRHNVFDNNDELHKVYDEVLIPATAEFLNKNGKVSSVSEYNSLLAEKFSQELCISGAVQDVVGYGDFSPTFSLDGEPVNEMYGFSNDLIWNKGNAPADWMTDEKMKILDLCLDDITIVHHFEKKLRSDTSVKALHLKPQDGLKVKETFQRARALALYLCHLLVENKKGKRNVFKGMFRVTSKDEKDEVADLLKNAERGRALIWIDVVDADIFLEEKGSSIDEWTDRFSKKVEVTFLLTHGRYCGNSESIVRHVKAHMEEKGITFDTDVKSNVPCGTLNGLGMMQNQVYLSIALMEVRQRDLSDQGKELRDTVGRALLGKDEEQTAFNIKLYIDGDDDGAGTVYFHIGVTNIKQLIFMCNIILFRDGQKGLIDALKKHQNLLSPGSHPFIDGEKNATDILDRAVLQLDTMNEEQMEAIETWLLSSPGSLRIDGAAGTGKVSLSLGPFVMFLSQ
jgi:hypothetical protein